MSDSELKPFENISDDIVGKIVEANTLESKGEIEKAIAVYQEIVVLDPDGNYGNVAREALANLQKSQPSLLTKEFQVIPTDSQGWFGQNLSLKLKVPLMVFFLSIIPTITIGSTAYFYVNQVLQVEMSEQQKSAIQKNLGLTLGLSSAVLIALVGLAASALATKITKPLLEASNAIDEIGKGKFDVRIPITGQDELAHLSSNINKMAGQIQDLLYTQEREAKNQQQQRETLQRGVMSLLMDVEGAQKGDLTVRAAISDGAVGSIADAFNSTLKKLQGLLQKVQTVSADVGQLSLAGEGSVRQLSESALIQAAEIEQALGSIDQINQSVKTIADYAQEAAKIARNGSIQAKEGDLAMDATVYSIEKIRTTVANTSKKVKQLAESSQEIAKIVEIISGISEKTNLLAFNASVEAARAGEHGEGFRIVAEEVRRLADRITESTKDIQQLVTAIQQDTTSVLQGMETSTSEVVNGSELVRMTKLNLQSLANTSQQIDEYLKSISTNTTKQTDNSKQVNEQINGIALVAKTNSTEAQNVVKSLKTLVQEAETLQSSVSQFKL
ncbi:methyl-accepting chemotaxis protein [Pleurocapsa sp. FMAR1]|uniref:methyl-accepting chemotaxis protein n=1 Tax=Pleurocapsa sp. FMAR1 TaxID=3040204 RepID=UPI0029C7FDA9|nr:methyl-accepting chemotaxis protein [Pleurocapsa sp. FMAR1]